MPIHDASVNAITAPRSKPGFVKLLAWGGVVGNIVYLLFTFIKLLYSDPQDGYEYVLSIGITIVFLYIYIKMVNSYSIKTYIISTLLACLWSGFLLFKLSSIKMIDNRIEFYFLFGSFIAIVVNLVALYKIMQCLPRTGHPTPP